MHCKRVFDIVVTAVLLALLAVPMALVALLVLTFHGRPITFRQRRPGLRGRPFEIVKFRTMRTEFDSFGQLLPDEKRLTAFGRFLRSSSLDELPELLNVLRGEMSLVGPRPLLMDYLERYTDAEARRHEVRPGITGWAQVNGRNAISWERRFELDVWYIDHWTFWLDIRILAMTVVTVLMRSGISARGQATMSEFRGSAREKGA